MSDTYDPLSALANQPATAQQAAPAYDPLAMIAAGKQPPTQAGAPQSAAAASPSDPVSKFENTYSPLRFLQGFEAQQLGGITGSIGGGLRGLWDLASGQGLDKAAADVKSTEQAASKWWQSRPGAIGPAAEAGERASASNWDPLNWTGVALGKGGQFLGNTTEKMGAPPLVSTIAAMAPAAVASVLAARAAGVKLPDAYVPEAERVMPEGAAVEAPPVDGPPVEGGMSDAAKAERQAILQRVGISDARTSALRGDAKTAATDYQATKFDEPAGRAMAAQFDHERDALAGYTQNLVKKVGGSLGLDEDALRARGETIAQPFDELRSWFGAKQKALYAEAQAKSDELAANGNPNAYTQLNSVDQLLKSPEFRNTLMARDQGGLLNAIQSQADRFRETNAAGLTPAVAEQYRQWLNSIWSPDNRWAIGQVKNAVDHDVFSIAGGDLYKQARAVHAQMAATLDNPNGISTLFDHDPVTPINRVTPIEKIPDRIMSLPIDQFQNVISTLKQMPPELRDSAESALGEIKGHLINKILQTGTETRSGRGAQVWRGEDVSKVIGRNAAKLRIAFDGDPESQAAIKDINSAGQILRADQSYPGAYAQAANLSRRGIGSSLMRQGARIAGAAAGSTLGPIGAAAGEIAGNAGGEAAASALSERAALKAIRSRIEHVGGP